jgi:RNA 3'-terminal phosphate cyclase
MIISISPVIQRRWSVHFHCSHISVPRIRCEDKWRPTSVVCSEESKTRLGPKRKLISLRQSQALAHGSDCLSYPVQWSPAPPESSCIVSFEWKSCSNRQDSFRRQESWPSRCDFVRFSNPIEWSPTFLADFEISLLRLLEKVTNGTVIEISVTGMITMITLVCSLTTHLGTAILLKPGIISGGVIVHDCPLTRSIGYFLEPVTMLAPFAKKPLHLTLRGITTDDNDLSVSKFANADFL